MKILALTLVCLSSAWATSITLTMDEVPFQTVNGLDVTKGGITFGFTDTTGADYDAADGGQETYVQDPSIEGQTAGELLTVNFSLPMYLISFGMADSTQGTGFVMASVNFYNGANLLGNQILDATVSNAFSQGELVYLGNLGQVTSIQITMNSGSASAFAVDNLYVNTSLPEPSTLFSSFAGIATLSWIALRRRRSLRQS